MYMICILVSIEFDSHRQIDLPWSSCPFNETLNATEPECKSPTTYFWYHTTLDASPSMDESGGLKWWIVLCLFAAWAIVFLIVMKGIQSSGNVNLAFRLFFAYSDAQSTKFLFLFLLMRSPVGCVLYITLSVHCAHHILHTGHNVERCQCRPGTHVHSGYGEIA